MTKRYTIKFHESYNSEEPDLIQIYDEEDMTYTGFFGSEDKILAEEICKLLNSLDYELKQANKEILSLNKYLPVDKHSLMKENIKLKNMLRYQEGIYNLEKRYFAECLLSVIEEYPESQGLLVFKDLMGW